MNYSKAFRGLKNKVLPKWKSNSICHVFLSEITRALENSEIPENEWYRVFSYVSDDHLVNDWIHRNITQPQLDFEEACDTFRKHFELAAAAELLAQEYSRCQQRVNESVQSYSDRFSNICARRNIKDEDCLAIQHFVEHLQSPIARKYREQLALAKLLGHTPNVDTLSGVISFAIGLEVATKGLDISNTRNYSFTSTGQMKRCKFHPNATSHTTYECRMKPQQSNQSSRFKPNSFTPKKSMTRSVQCYKCKEYGHYANKCPKRTLTYSTPQSASKDNSSSPSSQQNSWRSPPPDNRPQNFNVNKDGLRRTTRQSAPPDRFTPSRFQPHSTRAVQVTTKTQHQLTSNEEDERPEPSQKTSKTKGQSKKHSSSRSQTTFSTPIINVLQQLPTQIFEPRSEVLFLIHNCVYRTLVDTGATCSFIDQRLAESLSIPIAPISGSIRLANDDHTLDRSGRTISLVPVTALFVSSSRNLPSISFEHRFELLRLHERQFIIGTDLLPILFPHGIPLEYMEPTTSLSTDTVVITQHSDQSDCLTATILDEIPLNSSHLTSTAVSSMEGIGKLPVDEQPERSSVSTASDLESDYSFQRSKIEADPFIRTALEFNASITEFCSLPESVMHLEIDPSQKDKLYRKQYKVAETVIPLVTEIIDRWFNTGKITLAPPCCQFNSSLTVAPKKDDSGKLVGIRVCLDTRALNKALLVNDKFQIPAIRTALELFAGASIFGEFDLAEAYLQFKLDESSQPYTAFTWNNHQYMFVGCPFGLSLLPSHFQRVMSFLFAGLPFTFPYLDNLPFASSSWSDHRDHALTIINRLNNYNLKIKPSSIKFGHSELRCLGHVISKQGISINPDKLEVIRAWPLPRTGEQLQSFLGFATFLRQHVRHFADLTAPLEAVKYHKEVIWTDTMKKHFELTKEALHRAPILQFPDYSHRFVIATDASNTGIGGVLYQPNDDEHKITPTNIVAIHSQKLRDSQRNYPAYKKELFAIVVSLRKFHHFVWGRTDLIIITDHKPLTYMLSSETLSPSLQQWLDVILDHRFTIIHRPGKLNVLPDQLSRMYSVIYPSTWGIPSSTNVEVDNHGNIILKAVTQTLSDAPGGNPSDYENMLITELEKRGKKSPPIDKRRELVEREHSFGHFGREAIYKKLWSQDIWWPKMRHTIQEVINDCDACNRFVVTKSGFNPASFITASYPWDHVQVDCSVHLPTSPDGYTALLVIIDVFTGFIILRPLRSNTAEIVARKLWKVFSIFGIPKILQSDNGPEFANEILRTLMKLTGIDQRLISPYNPRADGKVERAIGTVTSIIKKMLHGSTTHWPLFTPFAQLTFNQKISSLTNSSPFALMFGRKLNELRDYTNDAEMISTMDYDNWKEHQKKILSIIYPAISDRIKHAKDRMIASLDKHRRVLKENSFPIGSIVMLVDQLRKDKFEPKYVGPYTIVRRAHNGAYVLKDATGDILDRHIPPDQLKLISRSIRRGKKDDTIYEVEKILDHRGNPPHYEYFVKWKNYDETQNTWEKASSFLDDSSIRNYWKSKP
jgi:hypothetical protein